MPWASTNNINFAGPFVMVKCSLEYWLPRTYPNEAYEIGGIQEYVDNSVELIHGF